MTTCALYRGRVSHARTAPRSHAFSYATYMLALNLDELRQQRWMPVLGIERAAPMSFRRRDYRGDPARPLGETIREDVQRALGFRPDGPIVLLTHVRVLGFVFNPVSFYYCFDARDQLVAVVAEITNTPWRERHAYVLRARDGRVEASFPKGFHVSPFMPMDQVYSWAISALGERLSIDMSSTQDGARVFAARLVMDRVPLTRWALIKAAAAVPLIGLKVSFDIYWQALRLALKRVPFFSHPKTTTVVTRRSES